MPITTPANAGQRFLGLKEQAVHYKALPPTERRNAAIAYLFDLAEAITLEAGDDAIIAPLLDVIPFLADPAASPLFQDRRSLNSPPSTQVLARAAATIDVLLTAGQTNDAAAQIVARQLVNAGASLPAEGGDVRGWKRLGLWRERLVTLKKPADAWRAYSEATAEVAAMERREALRRAQDGSLWNYRNSLTAVGA